MKEIQKIAVIGAGTMGHGIAEVFAIHGFEVRLFESNNEIRERSKTEIERELQLLAEMGRIEQSEIESIIKRITYCDDLNATASDADFVIEAIFEEVALKQELFSKLDAICKADAIFASNTSSLDLYEMIKTVRPGRVKNCLICHWYNPAHLIPLVELSQFGNTSDEVLDQVEALFTTLGKKTIRVLKNIPGLIANRIQQAIAREVFSLIEMGAASSEDIDKALKFGPAFRYATTGQLEVADFGGIDIWCTVGENLLPLISSENKPSALLRKKIEENKLGLKTGEGFFSYDPERREEIIRNFHVRLIHQLTVCENY